MVNVESSFIDETKVSQGGLGNFVTVQMTTSEGEVYQVKYAHLASVDVNKHQVLSNSPDTQIGVSGATGNATSYYNQPSGKIKSHINETWNHTHVEVSVRDSYEYKFY